MKISCPKCFKSIVIPDEKLPKDKEKAMVKCPGCQQTLVFHVPHVKKTPVITEERTIIETGSGDSENTTAKLVNSGTESEYPLKTGCNIIGRKADIKIENDPYISRKNSQIEVKKTGSKTVFILTDDGSFSDSGEPSANGTFHNGIRLTKFDKILLSDGDKIRVGHTEMVFVIEQTLFFNLPSVL
jgi:predicted Zn finger-like uncharacterized protein